MGKIEELIEAVRSIPGKKLRKNLVGNLRQYATITETGASVLEENVTARSYVEEVFPKIVANDFVKNVESAKRSAAKILELLEEDPQNIEDPKVHEHFTKLNDAVRSVQSRLKESWKQKIESRVKAFEPLALAARQARMPGSENLMKSIADLSSETKAVPTRDADVTRMKKINSELDASISNLGLVGKGGDFLKSATAGTAKAEELRDPEVIEFLDLHKLWPVLSVSIK